MLTRLVTSLVVASLVASVTLSPRTVAAGETRIGRQVEDFTLRDFRGKSHTLDEFQDQELVVLAFLGIECPVVKLYTPRLVAMAEKFASRGVAFVGVNANVQDTPTEIGAYARIYEVNFPILKDAGNRLADHVGAERTPQVFVLDKDRVIRYHGRIDDQYGVGYKRTELTRNDLATALEELLAGQPVSEPVTDAPGCFIGRVRQIEPHGEITYSNQIARILNRRCVECHRESELAPFPLTSYDEVIGWGDTICEVVADGRMPPWFADPKYGHFINDAALSAEEKQMIFDWVDNGSPEGDPDDLPEPPSFLKGWRIGQPDAVYYMEEEYEVAAEGTIDYQYFQIDPGLTEDVWITDAEARPGNSSVVHHVLLYAVPKGSGEFNTDGGGGFGQMVAIYAPGMPPWRYPEGTAMKIRAGSQFVMQMHYTSNGTVQKDRSYVGFKFIDEAKVKKRIRYGMALNMAFEIPPHASNHKLTSRSRFRRDTLLLNLFPHMHYRGKSFRFEALYPDGTKEVLLDVPHYDFNWQLRYDLAEPKLLPKGTRLLCTGYFDNSEDNLSNPDPTQTVRFGLQSWEEMMLGYYTTVPVDEDLTKSRNDPAGD